MSDFTGAGGAAYMSNRMDWETPQELFDQLDAEFHFTLDAASSDANHKCPKYFTAENSAFNHEWGGDGILQSSIRQSNRGVGAQMQYGGQPQRHPRRHAPARPHRHSMVPANKYYEDMSTPQPLPKLECEDTILAILQNEN